MRHVSLKHKIFLLKIVNTDKRIVTALVQRYSYCFIESEPSIDISTVSTSVISNVGELELLLTSENVINETCKFKTLNYFSWGY